MMILNTIAEISEEAPTNNLLGNYEKRVKSNAD
jgi:hypothetical protein